MTAKYNVKGELRKYRKFELLLHQLVAIAFVLLFLTGFSIYLGGGEIFELAHLVSGYTFLILFMAHMIYLLILGLSHDIPLEAAPFYVRLNEIKNYLRGKCAIDGKFSFPERLDYLSVLILSAIAGTTGLFLRLPRYIPGIADVSTVYSIHKIHFYAGIATSFWIFGYHIYFTLLHPLPGNEPSNILGKTLSPETIYKFRPDWFEELTKSGVIEVVEERIDQDKVDREKVVSLLDEGNEFFKKGQFNDAEKLYIMAIELYPAYSQAQYNLAVLYVKTGETEKAMNEYRRFLEIDPFNPLATQVRKALKELEKER